MCHAGPVLLSTSCEVEPRVNRALSAIPCCIRCICQRGQWSVSRVSRWSSSSCNFVRDGASGEPRSLGDSFVHSLLLTAGATVCKPCVTLVQCHSEHQWKPRGGVRAVATLGPQKCCERAFLPLPSESCKWEWLGAARHFNEMRPCGEGIITRTAK